MKRSRPITHARYKHNRTAKGRPTTTPVKRALYYYTYSTKERNPDQLPRNQWFDPQGEVCEYGHITAWAQGMAKTHKYTYQLMLSLRDGEMHAADFVTAMNEAAQATGRFADYRLIVHDDTAHTHAHVVAFSDKTLTKVQLAEWKGAVAEPLFAAETERLQPAQQIHHTLLQPEDELEWEL